MTVSKRPPVVALVEIISNDPGAGEYYRHRISITKDGRVGSLVECGDCDEIVEEWSAKRPPSSRDLAELLVASCAAADHDLLTRILSAVVHDLLPAGSHLWDPSFEVPDAVLDEALSFGSRTTYRIEIQEALRRPLKKHAAVAWALRIQSDGTSERAEFLQQVSAAKDLDSAWLQRALAASGSSGTPFDDLIARSASAEERASMGPNLRP